MSNRAALYLRSSKDRSDVSIDAQRRELTALAAARGMVIVQEFADAVFSGKDEERPGFQALLRALEARDRGWEHLLVLDTSRIARRVFIISAFEHDCEKLGIGIIYKNLPDMEPAEQLLFKTIMQGMDQYHSLKSRAKGLAGMAENIRQGWRAGGKAPRGYQLQYHATGAIREGTPVTKSRLVPGPDAAVMSQYLKARAAGEPRGHVLKRLGLDWSAVNANGIEWQAMTYAGHNVWGVHNERHATGYHTGEKRRPRAEWTITRDTHPALITTAEAEAILQQLERGRTRRTRTTDRPYLLTGLLTAPDGSPWHGEWDRAGDAAYYRLGKGRKVAARRVDSAVINCLRADLQSDHAIDAILNAMLAIAGEPIDGRTIAASEKKLAGVVARISNLVDQLERAEPLLAAALGRTISNLEAERVQLIEQLADMRRQTAHAKAAKQYTRADAQRLTRLLFNQMETTIQAGDIAGIKTALADLVEKIQLEPDTGRCSIHYRIETPAAAGFNLASPGLADLTPVRWVSATVLPLKRAA